MQSYIQTKQLTPTVSLSELSGEELLVTTEEYKNSVGEVEIPEGTLFFYLWGSLIGFLPNGKFRFWADSTLSSTPAAIANSLKFRRALPGESVTLSA